MLPAQAKITNPKNFQSYLFIGSSQEERLNAISNLCKKLGTNLKTNSPDFTVISPVKKTIGISQIRELKSTIYQKPSIEKFNTVLIKNADTLTNEAQNSLLKLIEEPPEMAVIIMEGDNKASFLPTVLSRVVISKVKNQNKQAEENPDLANRTQTITLEEVLDVEDPKEWINAQIQTRYFHLLSNLQNPKTQTAAIEQLANIKKMINANVNPKFLLANFIFSQNR